MYVRIAKHPTMGSSLHAKRFPNMLIPMGSNVYICLFTDHSIYLPIYLFVV